jgi:tetratricopeptide (TPR) repeat protein
LKEPVRREDVFVRAEVKNFARHYNDRNIIGTALSESKADKEYHDAVKAFDAGDYDTFLKNFFLAIHSRYDIENPVAKRFIRRKLNTINQLREENRRLSEEKRQRDTFLKKLAVEYVMLGKECEKEHMNEAAIANYRKALQLFPDYPEAQRRLKNLS